MSEENIRSRVSAYYTGKLRDHGTTPQGVDWSSAEGQALRFDKLLEVCAGREAPSILDYGCGYGALADHLASRGRRVSYLGFDLSPAMIEAARARHAAAAERTFTSDDTALARAEYAIASGIFNVKLDVPEEEWKRYVLATIARLDGLSTRGFAFNVLSLYSDPEKRRPDLHYADPLVLFDHCKRTYSRFVSLLHDYPLYEFTVLVKKDA